MGNKSMLIRVHCIVLLTFKDCRKQCINSPGSGAVDDEHTNEIASHSYEFILDAAPGVKTCAIPNEKENSHMLCC